jgi:hypothetical protein
VPRWALGSFTLCVHVSLRVHGTSAACVSG